MVAEQSVTANLKAFAHELGFELVGIAPAVTPTGVSHLYEWIERGFAGEMSYIPRRAAAYEHPRHVLSSVRSVVMVGWNYKSAEPSSSGPNDGRIARYAWGGADYHDELRARLQRLADQLHELSPGCKTRIVVDTAPLLERDFARLAGLGWFGKNTLLIHKRLGSFLFLGALLTDVELITDEPFETTHCGTCTRCLDVCPTHAFPEPFVLDARKCISYLTIELKSQIPVELRTGMGEWLFGCDLCQDVCPWNRKSPVSTETTWQPSAELNPASALNILQMTAAEFDATFSTTPLARPGWHGLRRNAAIVLGNHGDEESIPALIKVLNDDSPLVRGAAAWALGELLCRVCRVFEANQFVGNEAVRLEDSANPTRTIKAALQARLAVEDNPDVVAELKAALEVA